MPFIGTQPEVGGYSVLDALTASATANYTLQLNSVNFSPSSVNQLLVSLNGVIQKPGSSFTLSGSTLTFSTTLAATDSIDFIIAMGEPLLVGTPSDGTVTTAKLNSNVISGHSLVTLDNANDHVLINDATDGSLKKALIPAASFDGIDDQSSSNDDQLTIKDTEVVINEDSDDVDFRVESDGDANCLFVDASTNRVGIGTSAPSTLLDVDGTTKSKNVTVASSDSVVSGFSGQLLTLDGTGGSNTGDAGVLMKTPTNSRGFVMDNSAGNEFRIFGGNGFLHASDFRISNVGNVTIGGSLSKGSGSFKIRHPLESKKDTHWLVHSFVEGPQADNIYRGKVALVKGKATQNIDTVAGMSEGTFDALNREVQCFTTNETGWTAIKGSVSKNILTITAQDDTCTDTISWMVIGERKDEHMMSKHTKWTDSDGKIIIEPELTDREKLDKTDYVEGVGE